MVSRGWDGVGELKRQNTEDFYVSENPLYEIIMMDAFVPIHRMYNTKSEP